MQALPTISVVVPAYNYGRFLAEALDSALSQDYPSELYEVVVIDDGSTDDTAEVAQRYVEAHPDRVRFVQQQNRGYVPTVNRGITETTGELLALLDADDVWLPGKLRLQVEMLIARPELGLVYADMTPVDSGGSPFERESMLSWIRQRGPLPYRSAARILWTNEAIESTIVVRRAVLVPIPEELPLADWWIALQASLQSEIDWVRTPPLALYRMHGANMNSGQQSGVGSAPNARVFLTDIRWKLLATRRLDMGVFTPAELVYVWSGIERSATEAIQAAQSCYLDFTGDVTLDLPRAQALLAGAEQARHDRCYAEATRLAFEALLWNPYLAEARGSMHGSASAFEDQAREVERLTDAVVHVDVGVVREPSGEGNLG